MKKIFSKVIKNVCDRYGVTKAEFITSCVCVVVGGGYLFYTYLIISVCS